MTMDEWKRKAACGGQVRDELFFPKASSSAHEVLADEAEQLFCGACPVRAKCLSNAIERREPGIWAGTTERTRQKLTKTRNRVKCPVCSNKLLAQIDKISACLACGASWKGERPTI